MEYIKDFLPNLDKFKLKPREEKFVYYYCENGFNSKEALQQTGYTGEYCRQEGARILRRPRIKEAIKEYLRYILEDSKISLEKKLFDVLYARAFFDTKIFVDDNGDFKPLEEIPVEWRPAIDNVEIKYYGKDADKKVVVLKLANRDKAVEQLAKYIEMVKDVNTHIIEMTKETEDLLKKVFDGDSFVRNNE